MRKFKNNNAYHAVTIEHETEGLSIFLSPFERNIQVYKAANGKEESSFYLYDCNPEKIANELLEWCSEIEHKAYYSPGKFERNRLSIGQDWLALTSRGEWLGSVKHSIPNFKAKLKDALEAILEPEEKASQWEKLEAGMHRQWEDGRFERIENRLSVIENHFSKLKED